MSSIGSIGGPFGPANPFATAAAGSSPAVVNAAIQDPDGDFDASPASEIAGVAATSATSGGTSVNGTSLQDQILTAVKQAVAGYDSSPSSTSMQQTIQNAVDGVLKQNGIDPSQLIKGHRGHHHHGHGQAAAQPMPASSTTGSDGTSATSQGTGSDPSQVLASLLGGTSTGTNGADQGFDLQAALQPFLQGLPPGSALDTQA